MTMSIIFCFCLSYYISKELFIAFKVDKFTIQVSPDITRWSGSTERMRVTGEARIKYLSSQTRPHDVSEVSLGGEMLVLGGFPAKFDQRLAFFMY